MPSFVVFGNVSTRNPKNKIPQKSRIRIVVSAILEILEKILARFRLDNDIYLLDLDFDKY